MDIKISCIIPYYNGEKEFLQQCVESILQQDFEDYEILIVNDGSDEVHAAGLEEIRNLDSRIKVISQPNRGVSAARNRAMLDARGEYVAFVDADDFVVSYFFSEAYNIAKERKAKYVVGGTIATHSRQQHPSRISDPEIIECSSKAFRTDFLVVTETMQDDGYFGRGPVARLISREIALQVLFPENVKLGEDSLWNMDVLAKCDKIYKVYQIWYIYWQHPDSTCHRYNDDMVEIIEEHLNELAPKIDFGREDEAEAYFLRMYEFLRQQVFGSYLGRKECPLPVRKRARMFRSLLGREPWNLYEGHVDPKKCDQRTRGKLRLVHSGMLFWFWYFRSFVRGNKEG
ncbi:MAG: glycosyltransferase family 2 protein [Lachnospiraceae bacterium]|nr:glycosyltransferase family 2 protein [Lachnospiraceae bacterium]